MLSTDSANRGASNQLRGQWVKAILLLVISLGLLWVSEEFSPANIFEPQSMGWILWVSYAKDLIQPFAFYLFICISERWLKTWQIRALLALAVPTLLETGQFFYYRISPTHYVGSFDPLDIVMYIVGVGLAVIAEQIFFARLLKSYFK